MWALYLGSIRKVGRVVTSINKKQPSIYIIFNVYALKDMSVKLFCLFFCIKYNVLIIVICIISMNFFLCLYGLHQKILLLYNTVKNHGILTAFIFDFTQLRIVRIFLEVHWTCNVVVNSGRKKRSLRHLPTFILLQQ